MRRKFLCAVLVLGRTPKGLDEIPEATGSLHPYHYQEVQCA
jgi:hypothetical protein